MRVDQKKIYQTMESFGTSGAWWAQYVGGFTEQTKEKGVSTREAVAGLLFDRQRGIGLTNYRFNLGAGSKESGKGVYWDEYRRAASLEHTPGRYDFDRDRHAVWFLKKAVSLGVEEVVLFCNSPLERLTDNGSAQMTPGKKSNIRPENYRPFAVYCMDIAERFLQDGIPVRVISPINEPQWDWESGQEGCHYEPKEMRALYRVFAEELEKRPALKEVSLGGPESGEWKGRAEEYTEAILRDDVLRRHFKSIDNHSYWSDARDKERFRTWMDETYPDVKLRMSEWCEMVNGSDVSMDSALCLARVLAEDLRILDVVSWQNWVAAAPGGYRDGLVYINRETQEYCETKRLWSFGNFSRFVRPGYVRIGITGDNEEQEKLLPTAFVGGNETGERELVMVFVNEGEEERGFFLSGAADYSRIRIVETSEKNSLVCTQDGIWEQQEIRLSKRSVTTVILNG